MSGEVIRVTMIKIPSEEHQAIALQGFESFTKVQQRVSPNNTPYILTMQAGRAHGPAKDAGYTFIAKSVFRNMQDMEYYMDECEGHAAYREFLKENVVVEAGGLLSVWFVAGV